MKFGFNKYFMGMVACAFLSVISFFNINSLWSETTGNGLFLVIGILAALGAIYFGWRVNETTGGGKEER